MTEGGTLYETNINETNKESTIIGYVHTTKVNLLERLSFCERYDLNKIPLPYGMEAL